MYKIGEVTGEHLCFHADDSAYICGCNLDHNHMHNGYNHYYDWPPETWRPKHISKKSVG